MILLGTVAIEPNRWSTIDPSGRPLTVLADWLDEIAAAGFDGIELWERHACDAVLAHGLPIHIFNSYASLDDDDLSTRLAATAWAARAGAGGIKFNVGTDPSAAATYATRSSVWAGTLPDGMSLLCECHAGTAADDVDVAASILSASGPPARVGAIVHTHDDADHLQARFEAYGERITHVHVNHLDGGQAPRLADIRGEVETKVGLLLDLGFRGSWTIEFVHGTLTDRDHPAELLAQAAEDLALLRELVP